MRRLVITLVVVAVFIGACVGGLLMGGGTLLGAWFGYHQVHRGRLPVVGALPTPDTHGAIVPLKEIHPGMTGFCLSPDQNGIDRISVAILGVQRLQGYQDKILIQLTSGRAAAIGIARGMSGSQVYLDDGRLMGVVSHTLQDSDHSGLVTPIEQVLAQSKHAQPGTYQVATPPVPAYLDFCMVWGDADACESATLSLVKDGIGYATGHSLDGDGSVSGSHQMAVFTTPVLITLKSSPPIRDHGLRGDLVGTMVWDGASGSIIQLGKKPDSFTTHLVMPGVPSKTLYAIRQNRDSSGYLAVQLANLVGEYLDMNSAWDAHIVVHFTDETPDLTIDDNCLGGLLSLQEFLGDVLAQNPEALGDVTVTIHDQSSAGEFALTRMYVVQRGSELRTQFTLTGVGSHQEIFGSVALPPQVQLNRGMRWYLGRTLQTAILQHVPAVDAVPMLNYLSDRRAIYVACVSCQVVSARKDNFGALMAPKAVVPVLTRLRFGNLLISRAPTMLVQLGKQKPDPEPPQPSEDKK